MMKQVELIIEGKGLLLEGCDGQIRVKPTSASRGSTMTGELHSNGPEWHCNAIQMG